MWVAAAGPGIHSRASTAARSSVTCNVRIGVKPDVGDASVQRGTARPATLFTADSASRSSRRCTRQTRVNPRLTGSNQTNRARPAAPRNALIRVRNSVKWSALIDAAMAGWPAQAIVTANTFPAAGVSIDGQTQPRVARIIVPVAVESAVLTVTLSGLEDMNVVEARSATTTATVNRAATRDVVVELTHTHGTAARPNTVEPLTIVTGETTRAAMLTASTTT